MTRRRAVAGAAAGCVLLVGAVVAWRERDAGLLAPLDAGGSRLAPGLASYVVEQGGVQIGYATSRIDTVPGGLLVVDEVVTDLPIGGKLNRVTARLRSELGPALALRTFALDAQSPSGPIVVTGRADGDTALVLTVAANGLPPDTQRVVVPGALVLPTAAPLAVALGKPPAVGREYRVATFDPLTLRPRVLTLQARAESLFVVSLAAALDPASGRWRSVRDDTVRAWRLAADSGGGFAGWVAGDGTVVRLEQAGGFVLQRAAREIASGNFQLATQSRARVGPADADILESTAIAASAPLRNGLLSRLRVRLSNVDARTFDVGGDGQRLRGDTLAVERGSITGLDPGYSLPADAAFRARFASELAAEPLLQVDAPGIRALATRLAAGATDPRVVAERINRWVYDSLAKDITIGVPSALQVLAVRSGDCNEHTQLYLALARAAGIPARGAAGLVRVGRKFYYHAWPAVYLGRWVPVDPTLGEFPADAGHLRFVTGGLGRQAELLRLIGTLKIDVIDSR